MKINSEQEIEIIKLYDTLSVNSIAKKYDVSRQYICLILEKNKIMERDFTNGELGIMIIEIKEV